MYLYVSLCISMYLYVSLCISMYLYVYLCIPMYIYVSLCISMYLYISLSLYIYIYICHTYISPAIIDSKAINTQRPRKGYRKWQKGYRLGTLIHLFPTLFEDGA